MKIEELFQEIALFSKETHGSSDYHKEELYVMGQAEGEFAPLKYLSKKIELLNGHDQLIKLGFIFDALDLIEIPSFKNWYEKQFARKLARSSMEGISVLYLPNNKAIFDALEVVNKNFEVLRQQQIILNGKKLPVQLGEWYAKCIFGLKQSKSTSQRGFDFYLGKSRTEVRVSYGDKSSPKGTKLKKSLVSLSEFTIIIYVAKNFMIREVCYLDSQYIMRKFGGKGHTIFLKDADISTYFFSQSARNFEKVVNVNSLMRFASPTLAMKLTARF